MRKDPPRNPKEGRKRTTTAEDSRWAGTLFGLRHMGHFLLESCAFISGQVRRDASREEDEHEVHVSVGLGSHSWVGYGEKTKETKRKATVVRTNHVHVHPLHISGKPRWNRSHQPVFHPGSPPFTTRHRPSTGSHQAWTCGWGRPEPCLRVAPNWLPVDCPPSVIGAGRKVAAATAVVALVRHPSFRPSPTNSIARASAGHGVGVVGITHDHHRHDPFGLDPCMCPFHLFRFACLRSFPTSLASPLRFLHRWTDG